MRSGEELLNSSRADPAPSGQRRRSEASRRCNWRPRLAGETASELLVGVEQRMQVQHADFGHDVCASVTRSSLRWLHDKGLSEVRWRRQLRGPCHPSSRAGQNKRCGNLSPSVCWHTRQSRAPRPRRNDDHALTSATMWIDAVPELAARGAPRHRTKQRRRHLGPPTASTSGARLAPLPCGIS